MLLVGFVQIAFGNICIANNSSDLRSILDNLSSCSQVIVNFNNQNISYRILIENVSDITFNCNNNKLRFLYPNYFHIKNSSNIILINCEFDRNLRFTNFYVTDSYNITIDNTYYRIGGYSLNPNNINILNITGLTIRNYRAIIHPDELSFGIDRSRDVRIVDWYVNNTSSSPNAAYLYLFNSRNITIQNITMNFPSRVGGAAEAFRIIRSNDTLIRDVFMSNNRYISSIFFSESRNIMIENITMNRSRQILVLNSNNITIKDSRFDNILLRNALILRNTGNVTVQNNTFSLFIRYAVVNHRSNVLNDLLNNNTFMLYLSTPYYVCPSAIQFEDCD
ncbi:MAG: right-handed parallel beta-helix repeat-containing protein [Candidatus Micrarchaeota archaeon]|nr:right-handed parallel beta-helix repeat-containing protein [Candidatus Micrarchaeota archaeon]